MSDYEPPAEMVEALVEDYKRHAGYLMPLRLAKFVLRRQHERESRLRAAAAETVAHALDAHHIAGGWTSRDVAIYMNKFDAEFAKLDAPKVPTLLEAAKAMLDAGAHAYALTSAREALKAAVEREEANG